MIASTHPEAPNLVHRPHSLVVDNHRQPIHDQHQQFIRPVYPEYLVAGTTQEPPTHSYLGTRVRQSSSLDNITIGTAASKISGLLDAVGEPCSSQSAYGCQTEENYDSLMGFNPSQTDFASVQLLWNRKEVSDILLRVSFVAPIILLGIAGNLTIIYSMCRFKTFRRKPTNIFILNMALADLLTTLVCPMAALFTDIYQFYVLGSFVCHIEGFIKITCLLVSSYSLIVLSSDWLLSVVKPCRKRITIEQSWFALMAIWLVSIMMASPLIFWRNLRQRQWRDLTEVWCCELLQYTKYYWILITFFLIYIPTIFMTIVLVVILARMDRFEAKLRRERTLPRGSMTSSSSSISTIGLGTSTGSGSLGNSGGSLSINVRYRRRIVQILFTYLLTSIICWSPLQFTIIYRHFRTEAVPAAWFFELSFFAQLSASLTAAMNPIIFGFLSEPFRRLVSKFWLFRFLDKIVTYRSSAVNQPAGGAGGVAGIYPLNQVQQSARPVGIQCRPDYENNANKRVVIVANVNGSTANRASQSNSRVTSAQNGYATGSTTPRMILKSANTTTKTNNTNQSRPVDHQGQDQQIVSVSSSIPKLITSTTAQSSVGGSPVSRNGCGQKGSRQNKRVSFKTQSHSLDFVSSLFMVTDDDDCHNKRVRGDRKASQRGHDNLSYQLDRHPVSEVFVAEINASDRPRSDCGGVKYIATNFHQRGQKSNPQTSSTKLIPGSPNAQFIQNNGEHGLMISQSPLSFDSMLSVDIEKNLGTESIANSNSIQQKHNNINDEDPSQGLDTSGA